MDRRLLMGATFLAGVLLTMAAGAVRGPSDYDDCVLRRLDSGANQMVAGLIVSSCRAKFPDSSRAASPDPIANPIPADHYAERALTYSELTALSGRAGPTIGNLFGGSLYNGLDSVRLSEVIIEVGSVVGNDTIRRRYRDEIFVAPLTTGTLQVEIVRGEATGHYFWNLMSARGRTLRP